MSSRSGQSSLTALCATCLGVGICAGGCRSTWKMCHPPEVCTLDTVTAAQAGPGFAAATLASHSEISGCSWPAPGSCSSLLHVGEENTHGVQVSCFSCDSCQGQDLNQGGHSACGDTCAMRAHLGNDCSFGNHLMWLPPSPGCAWTCWPEGKTRLPGHRNIFPCCSRKPPVTWHSQRCHPEQCQPASSLLSPPLRAPTLIMAGGLLMGEEHLQRLPVAL